MKTNRVSAYSTQREIKFQVILQKILQYDYRHTLGFIYRDINSYEEEQKVHAQTLRIKNT